jgi:CheY-like chemotaxis protein
MQINLQEKPAILIVDDDTITQNLVTYILHPKYDIHICGAEQDLYEVLKGNRIDLILMDLTIKGTKGGLGLLKEIKISPEFNKIPVICLSAQAQDTDRKKVMLAGADGYLSKPVDKKTLIDKILALLDQAN